jgi:hypothetical protein
MALQRGTVDKKVYEAIVGAGDDTVGVQAADITDATTAGKALLTAASAAAQRTALGNLKEFVSAPASASATGTAGQWAVDTGFVYVCTATNTWKRVAIATW